MRLIAELTMPNNNSWNGVWTGEKDKYTVAMDISKKQIDDLIGDYSYDFGDGWRASVQVRLPEHRERVTNRFCGYEWMLSSIRVYGDIVYPTDRAEEATK